MIIMNKVSVIYVIYIIFNCVNSVYNINIWSSSRSRYLKEHCPKVKALRNFNINDMMGFWYVVQYYASSEEAPEYSCMRSIFTMSPESQNVTMNFTYVFLDDPIKEQLQGNLTWYIPNFGVSAHWVHTEDIYEGVYNTYIIDTDYNSWALIMHCAEKSKSPKYLSSLLLSRKPTLGINIINFLREKLPIYNIDTSFMFPINQEDCDVINIDPLKPPGFLSAENKYQSQINNNNIKHPLQPNHKDKK